MAQSIGPKGFLEVVSTEVGPERNVSLLSFNGRGDTGFIDNSRFRVGENPVAIVNVTTGALATSSFNTTVANGGINQTDTGANDGRFTGHTFFAIVTDTGTAGLNL